MTTVLTSVLVGLVVLLWPPRRERLLAPEQWRQGPSLRAPDAPRAHPPVVTRPHHAGSTPHQPPGGPRKPWATLGRGRTRRRDAPEEVADALVLVALGLRAGLPLTSALDQVGAGAVGAVHHDLAAVVAALRWGLRTEAAWGFAGPRWRSAAAATQLSEQTGAAAAELLETAAARMREEHGRHRERAAARAGVLLVLPLGFGFLPAFACTAVVPVVVTLAAGVLSGGR